MDYGGGRQSRGVWAEEDDEEEEEEDEDDLERQLGHMEDQQNQDTPIVNDALEMFVKEHDQNNAGFNIQD